MTRQRKVHVITITVLALALGIALARKQASRSAAGTEPATPQDFIYAMLDAARSGNVKAYLDSYAGQMRASLEQSVRETTADNFSKYLRDSNAAIKGVAISDPQTLGGGEASVRVEYVFQDRNEAQIMYLEKDGNAWRITRVDGAERLKTLIPYGTPVR
ncbi:MAG TPA: hypothetical protein VE959_09100 [Bryobacteraceae bacterium]|nr:hypothetical protein [Bryobacteraceae bacterium]